MDRRALRNPHHGADLAHLRPRGAPAARDALVENSCEFIADTGRYDTIYLHTNPAIEGAEPFWRSVAEEVCDARGAGDVSPALHFEIPVRPTDSHSA